MSNLDKYFIPSNEALELRNLGFNEECFGWYFMDGSGDLHKQWIPNQTEFHLLTPLYSQVFDYFREEYNLNVWIDCDKNTKWIWTINFIKKGVYIQSDDKDLVYNTYEQAELACLQKLIEIVK